MQSFPQEQTKEKYFEYTLNKLLLWNNEFNRNSNENDFSLLKVLKLLFFVVSAKTEKNKEYPLLDEKFNSFYAMPFGHVETGIYKSIKSKNLEYYTIDDSKTVQKNPFIPFTDEITKAIDDSIDFIKLQNECIITYSAFDLVNLSHTWYSWKRTYKEALSEGSKSKEIPTHRIKNEDKVFSLNIF